MSKVTGIFVSLTTSSGHPWSGTDNNVYVGVVGTVGGREFSLDVPKFNDYERGSSVTYSIGPGADFFGGRKPQNADRSLSEMLICAENVTHIYLRKQGNMSTNGDDLWELESAAVFLVSSGPTRTFQTTGPMTFGNEYGLQLWLAEVFHSGAFMNARIPVDGVADCKP